MPSIPASTMQATTSGAIDQNISRPSCSNRDFSGFGTGVGWEVGSEDMLVSIPAPKG
ncbi:hypothetical protein BN979_05227 [Mycolicibacterium vulneris]|nr:hypothetical protein BN979_05227 [Mycolicibacterium vulneris]